LVGGTVGSIQGTFANVKNDEKAFQIFLEVMGIVYGLFAASQWGARKNFISHETLLRGAMLEY